MTSDCEEISETMETCQLVEFSPQEKAVRILLIFDCIIKQADLGGLKKIRLVCKSWHHAATSEILKRKEHKLDLVWDQGQKSYTHFQNPVLNKNKEEDTKRRPKCLSEFHELLKNSTNFPWPSYFTFKNGDMDDPSCTAFFHVYGKQVETLIMSNVSVARETFRQMVNANLPNLKKLSFSLDLRLQSYDQWTDAEHEARRLGHNPCFRFPSLEILHFDGGADLLDRRTIAAIQMVKGAPKLKSVGNLPFADAPDQFWPDGVHLLKECFLHSIPTHLEDFERFVGAQPRLKILSMKNGTNYFGASCILEDPLIVSLIAQLLQSSSETLQILRTNKFPRLPIEFEMKQLTHLFLEEAGKVKNFPRDILAKFFPRLEFISWDFSKWPFPDFEDYFAVVEGSPGLTSVKHLQFKGELEESAAVYRGINYLFPNLSEYSMEGSMTGERQVSDMFSNLLNLKWANLGPNKRVSRHSWFKAVMQGEGKKLAKMAMDHRRPCFGDVPLEEPELFQI